MQQKLKVQQLKQETSLYDLWHFILTVHDLCMPSRNAAALLVFETSNFPKDQHVLSMSYAAATFLPNPGVRSSTAGPCTKSCTLLRKKHFGRDKNRLRSDWNFLSEFQGRIKPLGMNQSDPQIFQIYPPWFCRKNLYKISSSHFRQGRSKSGFLLTTKALRTFFSVLKLDSILYRRQ